MTQNKNPAELLVHLMSNLLTCFLHEQVDMFRLLCLQLAGLPLRGLTALKKCIFENLQNYYKEDKATENHLHV